MISWFERHNKISLTIAILIAGIIFYLSSLTFENGIGKTNAASILYHIIAFFFLSLFLLISLVRGKERYSVFVVVIIISIIYGISDEIHQFFVPGRTSSLSDVGINAIGILFAFMAYLILIKHRKNIFKTFKR